MKLKLFFMILLAVGLSYGVTACAPAVNLPERAMPAGASFTGIWYSDEFGQMKITVNPDNTMHGTFEYRHGEINGTVEGGVMKFEWIQPGDFQVARREVSGHAYLVISDDGLEMKGAWGYGDNYDGGGKWTGRKATEIY